MAQLTVEGAEQLRRLAAQLRTADPKIRRELGASLRPEVKRITGAVQDTVRAAPSHGRQGLGHQRRAAKSLALGRQLSEERAVTIATRRHKGPASLRQVREVQDKHRAKQAAKAQAGAGLRETIASATAGSISTGSKTTGVSVTWKVRAAKLANSQRKLPRYFNREKGWRHPVFGDRQNWVVQKGFPYFDTVIKKHREELGQRIVEGMRKAAEAIVHET